MPPPLDLTPDQRAPAAALALLKEGNERFVSGVVSRDDVREAILATAAGQTPFVAVLSCIDSRVPVETVFDLTIGHAFSARVAGNVLSDDVLGSLEFACALSGVRLVVVLGHTRCGAVHGACAGARLGHLTGLLDKIQPSVHATEGSGDATDPSWVDAVAQANVHNVVNEMTQRSDVLRQLAEAGTVAVVGAMYDVGTGEVTFYDDEAAD